MIEKVMEFAKKLPAPVSTIAVLLGELIASFGTAVTASMLGGVFIGLITSGILLWKDYYPMAGTLFVPVHEYHEVARQVDALNIQINDLKNELKSRKDVEGEDASGLVPMTPSGDVIIDSRGRVNFTWKDSKKDRSSYTIVVRQQLGNNNQVSIVKEFTYAKVDGNDAWPVSFSTENMPFGEYVWTVKPTPSERNGLPADDSDPTSTLYRRFSVYPSMLDKIKALRTLVVGTSLIPDQLFFSRDNSGKVSGYEPQLINLLTERLRSSVGEVAVNFRYLAWDDLLPKVNDHEIDIVVSSMTKTKAREIAENVQFSDGYYTTHQRFVARSGSEQCLAGEQVGVLEGKPKTTNEIAVDLLKPRFRYTNIKRYTTSLELFKALDSGDVNVILVDDISAQRYYNANDHVEFFGPNLDEALSKLNFYDNIGFPKEEFGIAVSRESRDLLTIINGFLEDARKNGTLEHLSGGLIKGGLKQVSSVPLC